MAEKTIFPARLARRIKVVMLTSGLDSVGSIAYRFGLPAKSDVGGGIAAVAPGKFAVAVCWSPELDRFGHSMAGIFALEVSPTCPTAPIP